MVRLMSYNPAKILGIDRGTIEVGKIADIINVVRIESLYNCELLDCFEQEDFGYDHFLKNLHVVKEYAENNKLNLISFAYLLKKCISIFIPSIPEDYESTEFKNSTIDWLGMTVRELLQKFGTAIRNEVCDDFWVKVCLKNCLNKREK